MNESMYREDVHRHAVSEDGEFIYNSSYGHARDLVEELFIKAEHEVCILTNRLDQRVFSGKSITDLADYFMAKSGAKLRVLIESSEVEDALGSHPMIEKLDNGDRLDIRLVPESATKYYKYNFMVVDGKHFRYEADRQQINAIATFGDAKKGDHLRKIFDKIWNHSKIVKIMPASCEAREEVTA